MIVQLIVTGEMEKAALAGVLGRCFPELTFRPRLYVNGITSNPLKPCTSEHSTPDVVRKLAQKLVSARLDVRSRRELLPDLVVAVDDLERANAPAPERVMQWVTRGVREVLAGRTPEAAQIVQSGCSVHLLAPMPEAYLFADAQALWAAGVADPSAVSVVGTDLEDFETADPRFVGPGPVSLADRHHPKNYLRLLAPSFTETGNETGGAAALRALDCARLQERSGLRFLRSLLFDLAWAAGVNSPLGEPTHPLTWPEHTTDPRRRVLRNG